MKAAVYIPDTDLRLLSKPQTLIWISEGHNSLIERLFPRLATVTTSEPDDQRAGSELNAFIN
jgi:hypothetical protein